MNRWAIPDIEENLRKRKLVLLSLQYSLKANTVKIPAYQTVVPFLTTLYKNHKSSLVYPYYTMN